MSSRTLCVSIYQLCCSIDEYDLYYVFSERSAQHIDILKNDGIELQALVYFDSVLDAMDARQEFHRKNIHEGCCTMNISYDLPQPQLPSPAPPLYTFSSPSNLPLQLQPAPPLPAPMLEKQPPPTRPLPVPSLAEIQPQRPSNLAPHPVPPPPPPPLMLSHAPLRDICEVEDSKLKTTVQQYVNDFVRHDSEDVYTVCFAKVWPHLVMCDSTIGLATTSIQFLMVGIPLEATFGIQASTYFKWCNKLIDKFFVIPFDRGKCWSLSVLQA